MKTTDPLVLVLRGSTVSDIASFYGEVNRVFMADEEWQLGHSLDALDDMLYGPASYGSAHQARWLYPDRASNIVANDMTAFDRRPGTPLQDWATGPRPQAKLWAIHESAHALST